MTSCNIDLYKLTGFYHLFSVLFNDPVRYQGPIAVMLDDQNMYIEQWLSKIDRESEVPQENCVLVPLCTPQIPRGLSWCRTRVSTMRSWQLTTELWHDFLIIWYDLCSVNKMFVNIYSAIIELLDLICFPSLKETVFQIWLGTTYFNTFLNVFHI